MTTITKTTLHHVRTCRHVHCHVCAFLSKSDLRELGLSSFKNILSASPSNLPSFDTFFINFSCICSNFGSRLYNKEDYTEIFYGVLSGYDSYRSEISSLKDTDSEAYMKSREFLDKLVKMMHETWCAFCPRGVGFVPLPWNIDLE